MPKKHSSRRLRYRSVLVPVRGKPKGSYADKNGEEWISERQAEAEGRWIVREALQLLAGRPVIIPTDPHDRSIRRRLILKKYCQAVNGSPYRDYGPEPTLDTDFMKRLKSIMNGEHVWSLDSHDPPGLLLDCYVHLSAADVDLSSDKAAHESFARILFSDFRKGFPPPSAVAGEWRRFES